MGGYPRGRVVEVFGPESTGKTTLALHAIAEVQTLGGAAAIDAEHALDVNYAPEARACKVEDLLVSQPDTGEQALEIAEQLVRSGPSTWWSSTRSRRWCRARRSRARWATRTWACRRG